MEVAAAVRVLSKVTAVPSTWSGPNLKACLGRKANGLNRSQRDEAGMIRLARSPCHSADSRRRALARRPLAAGWLWFDAGEHGSRRRLFTLVTATGSRKLMLQSLPVLYDAAAGLPRLKPMGMYVRRSRKR